MGLAVAKKAMPADWSFVHVVREDLNRFLFSPEDIIAPIGQDGLVPIEATWTHVGTPSLDVRAISSRRGMQPRVAVTAKIAAASESKFLVY